MALSYGIAKKIIDHPSYNFGVALPFICAFYILNIPQHIIIPIFDIELNEGLSLVINVIGIVIYYAMVILMFLLSGLVSRIVVESKYWLILVGFFALIGLIAFVFEDNYPQIGLLFLILSFTYLVLVFCKLENGFLSMYLIIVTGGILSLLSFSLGILWLDGHYLFVTTATKAFGLATINPDSLKIGAIMLITSGYVIFYTIFMTGESISY